MVDTAEGNLGRYISLQRMREQALVSKLGSLRPGSRTYIYTQAELQATRQAISTAESQLRTGQIPQAFTPRPEPEYVTTARTLQRPVSRQAPVGSLSAQPTRHTGSGSRSSYYEGTMRVGEYEKDGKKVVEERRIVPGEPTRVKEKDVRVPQKPSYAGKQPSRLAGSVVPSGVEKGTTKFQAKAVSYIGQQEKQFRTTKKAEALKTPKVETPTYVSPVREYGGTISSVDSSRTGFTFPRSPYATPFDELFSKGNKPLLEEPQVKEFFGTIGKSFKYAFYESPKEFVKAGASGIAPYFFSKEQRPIIKSISRKYIAERKGEIFTTGLVTASFISPIVPTITGLIYLPSSIKEVIKEPRGSTVANVSMAGVGALGIFPYVRRAGVKLIGTEVPAEKVFAKEVLRGESQFPRTTSPKASVLAFEKARRKGEIPTAHVTPASFKSQETIGRGTSHEAGLYVTPYGKGSPYFTYLPEPSATPTISVLPEFATPQLVKVGVKKVSRIPEPIIRTKGFEQVNKFLESQAGKKTAYITKRSEARFRPELKGRFQTTGELEAVIPTGTKITRVARGNVIQRLAGFRKYTTYRGEVIPIKEYSITGGKVSTSEFVKQQKGFEKASSSIGRIKSPRIEIRSYPYKTTRPITRPTIRPTFRPTTRPTSRPTIRTSTRPTMRPSIRPSVRPSVRPSIRPSIRPTARPSIRPSIRPSLRPSIRPTVRPSIRPTLRPTTRPSTKPIQVFREKSIFKIPKTKTKKLRVKQPKKYAPTLWAVAGKVKLGKGVKRRTKELTGLEVRPI